MQIKCIQKKSPEYKKVEKMQKYFRLLSDINRLKIVCMLNQGSFFVNEIHRTLKLPQNLTSHHLAQLKTMNLVTTEKEGTFVKYSLNKKEFDQVMKLYSEMFKAK